MSNTIPCLKCGNTKVTARGMCRRHYMQEYRKDPVNRKKDADMWQRWYANNSSKYTHAKSEFRKTTEYKERAAEYKRNKYHSDVNFRLSCLLRSAMARCFNGAKSERTLALLGCDVNTFKQHIESQFSQGMSWHNIGSGDRKWNIDHMIPLSHFDLSDEAQLRKACHYSNLRPLWWSINIREGNRRAY